jgi:hypothetical protein
MTKTLDVLEKNVERRKIWERMQKEKAARAEAKQQGTFGQSTLSSTRPVN